MSDGSGATVRSGRAISWDAAARDSGAAGGTQGEIHLTARLSALAESCQREGKFAEAESLYREVISLKEKAVGPDDPSVLTSLGHLAALHDARGAYEEALPIYERIVASWQKNASAAEQTLLARALGDLAACSAAAGKLDASRESYRRALAILEGMFGPEHPQVVDLLERLAGVAARASANDPAACAALPDPEGSADLLYELAGFYHGRGAYARAASAYRELVGHLAPGSFDPAPPAGDGRAVGSWQEVDSLPVAQMLNSLARVHRLQGRYAQAECLGKRALAVRKRALGDHHPQVAQSLEELGELYVCLGRYQQAQALLRRSIAIRRQVFGEEHPSIAGCLTTLSGICLAEGSYREAERLLLRAAGMLRAGGRLGSSQYAQVLSNLAELACARGSLDHAELLLRQALAIEEGADRQADEPAPEAGKRGGDAAAAQLSDLEGQVLRLMAEGLSGREITDRLCVSGSSVNVCLASMLRKFKTSPAGDLSGYLQRLLAV